MCALVESYALLARQPVWRASHQETVRSHAPLGRLLSFSAKNAGSSYRNPQARAVESRRRARPALRQAVRASARMTASCNAASAQKKTVLVPVADGTDGIEAVTVIEVLRRAGAEVVVASVEDGRTLVECTYGIKLEADVEAKSISGRGAPEYDMIAIPGGLTGVEHTADHIKFHSVLQKHFEKGKPMGGCGEAPAILFEQKGFLEGFAATAHPSVVGEIGGSLLEKQEYENARVVVDNNIITSRGPGTAMEWALCLVERLYGKEAAGQVSRPMLVQPLNPAPRYQMEWRMESI